MLESTGAGSAQNGDGDADGVQPPEQHPPAGELVPASSGTQGISWPQSQGAEPLATATNLCGRNSTKVMTRNVVLVLSSCLQ